MSIYIVSHKEYQFPDSDFYNPIQVGNGFDNNLLIDNVKDNIAYKNNKYCELTALYWLWKNCKDKRIGLVHYRRYFLLNDDKSIKFNNIEIISESDVDNILIDYDLILPSKIKFKVPVYQQWARAHDIDDWLNVGEIIRRDYPQYFKSFNNVSNSKEIFLYNMFVGDKIVIDSYCSWLFDILFKYEDEFDKERHNAYQNRLYGFLSERLFNVWVDHNLKNIKYLDVMNLEYNDIVKKSFKDKLLTKIKNTGKDIYSYFKFKHM